MTKTSFQSFPPKAQPISQPGETLQNVAERQSLLCAETLPQQPYENQPSDPMPQQMQFPPNDRLAESKYPTYQELSPNATNVTGSMLENMMLMQQRQTETLILTHQQLTASMTLPQPSINIFKGDPLEYRTFVTAFDSRIQNRVNNYAENTK